MQAFAGGSPYQVAVNVKGLYVQAFQNVLQASGYGRYVCLVCHVLQRPVDVFVLAEHFCSHIFAYGAFRALCVVAVPVAQLLFAELVKSAGKALHAAGYKVNAGGLCAVAFNHLLLYAVKLPAGVVGFLVGKVAFVQRLPKFQNLCLLRFQISQCAVCFTGGLCGLLAYGFGMAGKLADPIDQAADCKAHHQGGAHVQKRGAHAFGNVSHAFQRAAVACNISLAAGIVFV